jgi:transcriptional regulator with XRE-family HTH domain
MKLTAKARQELAAEIRSRQADLGISYAEIARKAGVDPAQAGRICSGQFKTASANLVHICNILGVQSPHLPAHIPEVDANRRMLEAGVLEIWDQTPQDARRILKLLRQLAELRRTT